MNPLSKSSDVRCPERQIWCISSVSTITADVNKTFQASKQSDVITFRDHSWLTYNVMILSSVLSEN